MLEKCDGKSGSPSTWSNMPAWPKTEINFHLADATGFWSPSSSRLSVSLKFVLERIFQCLWILKRITFSPNSSSNSRTHGSNPHCQKQNLSLISQLVLNKVLSLLESPLTPICKVGSVSATSLRIGQRSEITHEGLLA